MKPYEPNKKKLSPTNIVILIIFIIAAIVMCSRMGGDISNTDHLDGIDNIFN